MKLEKLLSGLDVKEIRGAAYRDVAGIASDSRQVRPGDVFVAVKGYQSDGHDYVGQALEKGAISLVIDAAGSITPDKADELMASHPRLTIVIVDNSRRSLALMADTFYFSPSRSLRLVGITGTNGKTTTSYLIKSVLEAYGERVGLIGTIDYQVCGERLAAPNTTPESLELTRLLATMLERGATSAVMEVSSHALSLNRVDGCLFDSAVFTNLTQDHLDFHGDMDAYFEAKLSLFTRLGEQAWAIVNLDDPRGMDIVSVTNANIITYGLSPDAQIRAAEVSMETSGLAFAALTPKGMFHVASPLTGQYNLYNILAAIAFGVSRGIPLDAIARGLSSMKQVPGRFQMVEAHGGASIVVDYAHTPDAMERVLSAARAIVTGRVVVVFGCGGDRDRGKRPLMGEVAGRLADRVVVTSDNPRSEEPLSIIEEIVPGVEKGLEAGRKTGLKGEFQVIPDRREAIFAAVAGLQKGDLLVLAGKGHEDYQIIGDKKFHFDDREVAAEAVLAARHK